MSRDAVDKMEILLVEDNLQDANVAIQALRRSNMQCRISLVCDGEEAISFLHHKGEFAQAPTPNVLLLDMQLPKKEGQDVLADVQASPELKHIPVVVLAGPLDHQAGVQVQELHMDGLMAKPVELDKFIGAVKTLRRSWLTELALPSIA